MPKQDKESSSLSSPTGGQGAYLFVYGTLRKEYGLRLIEVVDKNLEYIGEAKVKASLYDLGSYPGAVKDNSNNEVVGDVFLVKDADKVFKVLDEYEGEEYSRQKEQVQLSSGKTITAWIYWYNQKTEEKQKIRQKNYLDYLKTKDRLA